LRIDLAFDDPVAFEIAQHADQHLLRDPGWRRPSSENRGIGRENNWKRITIFQRPSSILKASSMPLAPSRA